MNRICQTKQLRQMTRIPLNSKISILKYMLAELIALADWTFYQFKVDFVGLLKFLLTVFLKVQWIIPPWGNILKTKVHAKVFDK